MASGVGLLIAIVAGAGIALAIYRLVDRQDRVGADAHAFLLGIGVVALWLASAIGVFFALQLVMGVMG